MLEFVSKYPKKLLRKPATEGSEQKTLEQITIRLLETF